MNGEEIKKVVDELESIVLKDDNLSVDQRRVVKLSFCLLAQFLKDVRVIAQASQM